MVDWAPVLAPGGKVYMKKVRAWSNNSGQRAGLFYPEFMFIYLKILICPQFGVTYPKYRCY